LLNAKHVKCSSDETVSNRAFRVSLRISTFCSGKGTSVRVEGRLTAEGVADLRDELQHASPPVRLDLSGLTSLDDAGAQELLALSGHGIRLSGMSAYVQEVLKEATGN